MKAKDLLEHFISGDFTHENTSVIVKDDDTGLDWLVGAVGNVNVPNGRYLVYYEPVIGYKGKLLVTPDYTIPTKYDNNVYLLKMED